MANQHAAVPFAEILGERLREVNRTVAPSGAADGDREVAAAVAVEARQPFVHEAPDVCHIFCTAGSALQNSIRLVASGVRAQLRIVVRVGEAAHVEHHVRVERHAVLYANDWKAASAQQRHLHEFAHQPPEPFG